ncbi:mobilization protein [Bacteroides caccae]|uniref:Mobilization protein n=1 Tax=Bacteroides caccae TaxID=47678 RepID=A0A6L3KWM9_9BACE|nr:mobilization protein [Bacteroides caccae]KAA5446469.1 mobilization protein [Bacteroides caccae]KAA5465505.1 mobilization protein [Bacteroides caccae]
MAQKTSINIKPCNIGSSEPHNRRTAEYLARINKEKFYIRTDLMPQNEAWVAPDFGNTSLTERYNQIAAMVKEKTGRAMQTKDRERVNKKTGKVTIVRGSTPLKEGVVVIKEDTTMEQLWHFCEVCKERWGITPLQVFIHRDEGHYSNPEDIATWKPNLHAHIVWDWMNHDTGKSCKLDEKAMCEMQTVLAECLEMQRGISKKLTGKEHLERNDFIIAKQKQEAEQVKAEKEAALAAKEEAEAERQSIEGENKAKAERSAALDNEIADKQKKRDEIRKNTVDGILDSVGSLVGIGKAATLEKKYKQLAQEYDCLKKAFKPTVIKEVEKQTKVLVSEKQKAEAERDNAIAQSRSLATERDRAIKELNSQNENVQLRINNAVRLANAEKDKTIKRLQGELNLRKQVLAILADMLYAASVVFKRAIDAIIYYGADKFKSIFDNDEAADIKSVMQSYGETKGQQQAIGNWLCDYADSRQTFDKLKHRQTYKEVADVANGAYDWKIEKAQKSLGYN